MVNRKIPQFAPFLGAEESAALGECIAKNWITEGEKSALFVERLKSVTGARHAVLAPNGTLALFLALRAIGIGPGDEVVVPDCTFFASASAIEMTGAKAVFCDVDPETLQTNADLIAPRLTPQTRAIMPVHLFGVVGEMEPIIALANSHGLKVVEDAAQAFGVRRGGRHAGTYGTLGCFSFFADKTITTGEGGLVVTDDDMLFDRMQYLRNQGRLRRGSYSHPHIGYNFRMTDLQSAIGLVQLGRLDEIAARKRAILARYRERMEGVSNVRFPTVPAGSEQIPFRTVLFAERAHELMRELDRQGVETRAMFVPLHRQPAFSGTQANSFGRDFLRDDEFPGAVRVFEEGVCLPSFPALAEDDVDYICDSIRTFYA